MVKVYSFKKFDIITGENVLSQSKATAERIAKEGCEPITETEEEVSENDLDGNGFYCPA